jgi:hypothetical protein
VATSDVIERLFRPSVFNLLAPIFPGGVLLFGIALLGKSGSLPVVGGIPQMAATVFLAYVSGLVLYTVSGMCIGLLAYWLGSRIGAHMKPAMKGLEPWKDRLWRQLARQYIGDALSPILEAPDPPELLDMRVKNLKLTVLDPGLQSQQEWELRQTQLDRQNADFQWRAWYQALDFWFPKPQPTGFTEYPFAVAVHSIVATVILLLTVVGSTDWKLWIGSLAVFLITMLYDLQLAMSSIKDVEGRYRQMAGMLRELRSGAPRP